MPMSRIAEMALIFPTDTFVVDGDRMLVTQYDARGALVGWHLIR